MTPRPQPPPVPATPSRDDPETIPCPVCQRHFAAVGRQAYCSTACRKTAFRRRHQDPPAAIVIRAARPRREYTIYECPQLRAAPGRPAALRRLRHLRPPDREPRPMPARQELVTVGDLLEQEP